MSTTGKLIDSLINEVGKPQASVQLTAPPSPIFISKIATPHSPKHSQMHTPPRSPSGEKYLGRTLSPKTTGSLFDVKVGSPNSSGLHEGSLPDFDYSREGSKKGANSTHDNSETMFNPNFSKTDGAALAKAFKQNQQSQSLISGFKEDKRPAEPGKTPQPKSSKMDIE
jgi:hypothetical protein